MTLLRMKQPVLEERLNKIRARGEIKALGRVLDRDPEARASAELIASLRGVVDVEDMDGKRLVRAILGRSTSAQKRLNPIRRDEAFVCVSCSAEVEVGGARVRDHCSVCLHGLHVDEVPGDRANPCGGVLKPVDFNIESRAGVVIHFRCLTCGDTMRNRAHPSDTLPAGLQLSKEET